MSVRADSDTLRALPLFRDCDPVALQVMAFAAEKQDFDPGEDIITQGKKARAAFLILGGEAVLKEGEQKIGLAAQGYFLGEAAMIRSGPYSITATAEVAVQTARFSHELFVRVAREYPLFGKQVLVNMADKLGQSMRELEAVRVMISKTRMAGQ
jgi:CRP-like cAMP-binding protein